MALEVIQQWSRDGFVSFILKMP